MAMSTSNAGALINGAPANGERKWKIRLLKATFIQGYGDCQIDDVVEVPAHVYQDLVGYKFAAPVNE